MSNTKLSYFSNPSAEFDRSNLQPIILGLSYLWVKPQIMIHCHRFTLNGSFYVLIYARTGNIFAILISGSYFCIKKESIAHFSVNCTAKFWGSKMKILLLLEIGSCQSCHLLPKTSFLQNQTCQVIFSGAKIGSPNFPKYMGFVCPQLYPTLL